LSYTPKHFAPHELLPDLTGLETWATLDPHERIKLTDRGLILLDKVAELLYKHGAKAVKVNDYHWKGKRKWCGWRSPDCGVGAPHSRHRKGDGFDLHCQELSADEMRQVVREHLDELPELGGVELDVSWLHIDARPAMFGRVLWFKQTRS